MLNKEFEHLNVSDTLTAVHIKPGKRYSGNRRDNSSSSALVYGVVPFSYCEEDRDRLRINESR
jgi:hypothetical protein